MRALHTIQGLSAKSGGTSTSTYDLLTAMHHIGCNVDLMTLQSPDLLGNNEPWINALPNDSISSYGYSHNMNKFLSQTDYDLYHTNGLWLYGNHITCKIARDKDKPYVITPHGMLYPLALKRSYWKKWPLLQFFFNKDILHASCIHVTSKPELEYVRQFGYKGPIAIIANPVTIPEYIKTIVRDNHRTRFGFLGRLHPVKKIENIFYAASLLKRDDFEILIIGSGDPGYEQFLKQEVVRLKLPNIHFCGFLTGKEKYETLAKLSALFVPSDFENFGMIVPEALSVGTPVMASLGTPWEELNTHKCGWWCDRSPQNIAHVMIEILNMPQTDLDAMGERGKQLVFQHYTAQEIATKMKLLYDWIIMKNSKPEFVYG
uniref:glycosyltransferase n=1 Tax=Alistipes megaguti TaxID=2364787 RepID=UPI000EFD1A03|nr:glycosyltransferase [Alistipes megaguti]